MNPTWKAAFGIIFIFILGWFGGALTTLAIARHQVLVTMQRGPEGIAYTLERQTTHNLDLSLDQRTRLHALIVENLRQRMELQKQVQPEIKTANGKTLQEIDALLTPEQQERFHDNLVRFKERFGRNPFNVGTDDKSAQPAPAENIGSNTLAPVPNAPTNAK